MKKVMNIFDMDISHSNSWKEAGLECGIRGEENVHLITSPNVVEWVRENESFNEENDNTGITVITDCFLKPQFKEGIDLLDCLTKIGLIIESPIVHPHVYGDIFLLEDCFDFIFTFDKKLLESNPRKYKFISADWVCIEEISHDISEKNKLVSMIYSHHKDGDRQLRHMVANKFKEKLDLFGSGSTKGETLLKSQTLNDYRFSIVMENCISDYYYTEKIIDCFITGNVPLYRGTECISEFFDSGGIIQWKTLDELQEIIENLSIEQYDKMLPSIKKNFELAHKYINPDDILYELIQKCLDNNKYDTKKEFLL